MCSRLPGGLAENCIGCAAVGRYGVEEPYEKLKALTRGHAVTQQLLREFVAGLEGVPEQAKAELAELSPATYTGNAAAQARGLAADLEQLLR